MPNIDTNTASNDDATVITQPVKLSAHRHFIRGNPCGIYFYVPHDCLGFDILDEIAHTTRRIPCTSFWIGARTLGSPFVVSTKQPTRPLILPHKTYNLSLCYVKRRNHIRIYIPREAVPIPPDLPTVPGTNAYSYFNGEAIHHQPCTNSIPVGDPTITYILHLDSSEVRVASRAQTPTCAVQDTRCEASSAPVDSGPVDSEQGENQ